MLTIAAAMVMITRDRAFFRVSETLHFDAIIFLAVISWLIAGMLYRGPSGLIAPALISTVALGCLVVGPIWISANAASSMTARVAKLKTLHQATMLYAEDHSEMLPPANYWMDSISNRVTEEDFTLGKHLFPPLTGYHVAMNLDLSSKALTNIESHDDVILFFVSYKQERNASDPLSSIVENRQASNVAGSVRFFSEPASP